MQKVWEGQDIMLLVQGRRGMVWVCRQIRVDLLSVIEGVFRVKISEGDGDWVKLVLRKSHLFNKTSC